MTRILAGLLAFTIVFPATAQNADQVKSLLEKYKSESEDAAKRKASPAALDRAGVMANRAETALAAGRTRDAAALIREARWLLPAPAVDVPNNVSAVFGDARLRHGDIVNSISLSADGQKLATASKDGTVKIWDLANGHELVTYRGHIQPVRAVVFAPNGKFVVSCAEKSAHIWNPDDAKFVRGLTGHTATVTTVAVSADSKRVATGSDDKTARVWEAESGKSHREIGKLDGNVNSVAFSPDGKLLATATSDSRLNAWNLEADNPNTTPVLGIQTGLGALYQVAFTPDGRAVATC